MAGSWLPLATALVVSAVLATVLARATIAIAVDVPNARSLHDRPVPRTGGLAIFAAVVGGWLLGEADIGTALWLSLAMLGGVSLADDVCNLPVSVRLVAHLAAAGIFVVGCASPLGAVTLAALVFAAVWMLNLYNFMDGADGLAGGMAVLGFGTYGVAAWVAGDAHFAVQCACVAAAAAAFLPFNFQPARLFMGDVGSTVLGFLAAALGLLGVLRQLWPIWFPILVFSPFVFDATVTLMRRLVRRERFWQAHREHYYQRLVRMGWSHRRLALAEYLLMIAAGGSALAFRDSGTALQAALLAVWAAGYLGLALIVDWLWQRHLRKGGSV